MASCSTCAGSGSPCWIKGDSVTLTFDFFGAEIQPEDTILFTAKERLDDDPNDSQAVVSTHGELQPDGTVIVEIPESTTSSIQQGEYWWDIRIIREDGTSVHTRPATLCVHRPVTNRGV